MSTSALSRHTRAPSKVKLRFDINTEYVAQTRRMAKLRGNLECIQQGREPSTRSTGIPAAEEDVMQALKAENRLLGDVNATRAHYLAKKVGQQAYGHVSTIGEYVIFEFCGKLGEEELKIANERRSQNNQAIAAYWYRSALRAAGARASWEDQRAVGPDCSPPPVGERQ